MVLSHTTNHTYAHPFPTVTLAYFLRYCSPKINPFAAHVLSTDTISSHVDQATGQLHTTRIHLKKSRLPSAIVKLLPTKITGGGGDKASYVLETSVVDIKEGWMSTESRNLNFVGVLSIVEKQTYSAPLPAGAQAVTPPNTDVTTTMVFRSRVGERLREKIGGQPAHNQEEANGGWLAKTVGGWGTQRIQRSIETIASSKSEDQMGKSRDGMRVVLERLRNSGFKNVLELTRMARDSGAEKT